MLQTATRPSITTENLTTLLNAGTTAATENGRARSTKTIITTQNQTNLLNMCTTSAEAAERSRPAAEAATRGTPGTRPIRS
jgi:hypothetical protein